jgi:hypothetical protein
VSLTAADKTLLGRLAQRVSAVEKQVKRTTRTASLAVSSQEGGSHEVYDDEGNLTVVVGQQPDGTYTVVDVNGAPLATPSTPFLEVRPGCLVVTWDGLDSAGAASWLATFSHVRVYVTTETDTTTIEWDRLTHLAEFTTPLGGTVTLALPEATLYAVALVAVNTSGVLSPVSAVAQATPDPVATEGGVAVYYTADAPTGLGPNAKAEWVDTDNGTRSRWLGTEWQVIAMSPAALNLPGSLTVDMFLSTGGVIAGDPAGAGARLGSYGFRAYGLDGATQVETFRVDAATGNVTIFGELGTAPPGEVGVFMFSTKFSHAGEQVAMPTIQFSTGADIVQPRIEGNTAAAAGLFLSSGRDPGERESKLSLRNDEALLFVQAAPGGDTGTYLWLENDRISAHVNTGGAAGAFFQIGADVDVRSRFDYGDFNLAGQFKSYFASGNAYAFLGLQNLASTVRHGLFVSENVSARIYADGPLEVVSPGGAAWRPVQASGFTVMSDRRSKRDLAAPGVSGLDVLRAAPIYEWAYVDDEEGVRRLGPMADDLPDIVTVDLGVGDPDHFAAGMKGVSLAQQIAVLWQAVGELDIDVDGLRTKKPARKKRRVT